MAGGTGFVALDSVVQPDNKVIVVGLGGSGRTALALRAETTAPARLSLAARTPSMFSAPRAEMAPLMLT